MSSNIRIKRICVHCGEQFIAKTTVTKYCSHKCNSRAYKKKIRESKIEVSDNETDEVIPQLIKNPRIDKKEVLSIKEACKFVGLSKSSIYRLFDDGVLTPIKIRNRVFISREEIKKMLKI